MYHPSGAFDGLPLWQAGLRRGDIVHFPFVAAAEAGGPAGPELQPCLVLEVDDFFGRRNATLVFGTSATGKVNRGYTIAVCNPGEIARAGLDRPTQFVALNRITVSLDHSGFALAAVTGSPVIGCLDAAVAERMNAVRARLHAEADIARELRRERQEERQRWQQEGREFRTRNRALLAADTSTKGYAND